MVMRNLLSQTCFSKKFCQFYHLICFMGWIFQLEWLWEVHFCPFLKDGHISRSTYCRKGQQILYPLNRYFCAFSLLPAWHCSAQLVWNYQSYHKLSDQAYNCLSIPKKLNELYSFEVGQCILFLINFSLLDVII